MNRQNYNYSVTGDLLALAYDYEMKMCICLQLLLLLSYITAFINTVKCVPCSCIIQNLEVMKAGVSGESLNKARQFLLVIVDIHYLEW